MKTQQKISLRDATEAIIFGRLIAELINSDFRVEIASSGVDGGTPNAWYVYARKADEEKIPPDGYRCWVIVIPGNGVDFISDYTTNLENVLKPVTAYAEFLQDTFDQ
ncbi:MAG: hypothetical protein ACRECF_05430 [Methyloceanibacter sp.]